MHYAPRDSATVLYLIYLLISDQGKYWYCKGKPYQVIGVDRHSETKEKLVVYKALYRSKEFGKNAL